MKDNNKMSLYNHIEQAIRHLDEYLQVDDKVKEEDIRHAIRCVMRDNPDIFWYAYQWRITDGIISFRYVFSKRKTAEIKQRIDEVIQNDFQINYVRNLSPAEKVMYVYKWIILNCNYNKDSAYSQSIYSVFVLRNSVCSGYAKAVQCLLKLLDIDCRLVYGKLNGGEDNSKHCWNLVNIDGAFYHLDVCFGDKTLKELLLATGTNDIWEIGGINYNYFCVSTGTIMKSRTIEDSDEMPSSNTNYSRNRIEQLSNCEILYRKSNKGILLSDKGTTADIFLCTKDKGTVLKCYRDATNYRINEEYLFMDRLRGCSHLLHINDKYSSIEEGVIAIEQAVPVAEIIKSPDNSFSLKDALTMIRDISLATGECHSHNIFYHDIHLNNIYKTSEGVYKLADFGSCTKIIQTDALLVKERIEGSPWFMSPETFRAGVYSMASTTYSLSLLLYFIINDLTPPFWDIYEDRRAYEERYNGRDIPLFQPLRRNYFDYYVNSAIYRFLKKGLTYDENNRYKGIQNYISAVENLLSLLEEKDYTLHLTKPGIWPSLNTTIIRGNTTIIPGKRFHESQDKTESLFEDNTESNIIPARVKCPNCTNVYEISIDNKLYEQSLRPLLNCAPASGGTGGTSIIRKNTDYVVCPNCQYEITIVDCFEKHIISLPTQEGKEEGDTRLPSITKIKTTANLFDTDHSYEPCCTMPIFGDGEAPVCANPDFSFTLIPENSTKHENNIRKPFWKRIFGKAQEPIPDKAYSTIFAPAQVKRKSHMLVQVYLHLFEETEKVKSLAQESDKRAERRDYIPLQCKLKKGDKVDALLNIYGETLLMSDKKSVVWQGAFTKCNFDYFVPKDIDVDELSCVALLTVNNIPVGEMRFITRIVESPRKLNPEIIAHKYNKVFISYAHKDEAKVKSFHEGLKLAGIEHFFDRAYLKTGDVFPQVIQDYIDSADLFVLFWSENAAQSDYVQKERSQALERAFPQVKPQQDAKLSIYPMSIEPRAELPSDMKENYHFGEI